MKPSKEEIAERILHLEKMIRTRRKNLMTLETQEAQYGINVPIEIVNQITRLAEQIKEHEAELDQLQQQAVEGEIPIEEVEYRAVVAEAWSTPDGRLSVLGRERMALARLRLHITPERAYEIENDIRRDLAVQSFSYITTATLYKLYEYFTTPENNENPIKDLKYFPGIKHLQRSTRLSSDYTINRLLESINEYQDSSKIYYKELNKISFTAFFTDIDQETASVLSKHLETPINTIMLYSTAGRIARIVARGLFSKNDRNQDTLDTNI